MQPTLVAEPFHREGWVYEEKSDGWRIVAYKEGPKVRLVSRNGRDHTDRLSDLAAAIAALPAHTLILDGEVCVFDEDLVSQFQLLGEPYIASGRPFYSYNQPGAKASQAVIENWWRQGMMGSAKAHYDGIRAFSETDFTEDQKVYEKFPHGMCTTRADVVNADLLAFIKD
jgi:hypothetical protein